MSAGCISMEADVFYSHGDVVIGHSNPTSGRTLTLQYIQPLRSILDYNNGGKPGNNGLYRSAPRQSITLLVDFKSSDKDTLDAVVAALQPLRDGKYLSHVAAGSFVERQVTIVASGNAPFERIFAGDGIPNRDLFYDAHLDKWDDRYNSTNSFYASVSFKNVVRHTRGEIAQKELIGAQSKKAHDAGLKVRTVSRPALQEPPDRSLTSSPRKSSR